MDKELAIKNAKKKFRGTLKNIVIEQIELFFKILESDFRVNHNYKIGDNVLLNKNHLLHGIGNHLDFIENFSKVGIVSPDYLGECSNHAFCYNSAFWSVDKDISLKEYIKNYSGMIVKINDKYLVVPYGQLDKFVEKIKDIDHWLWTAESSMEIRFMPSLARNINQIGFILNLDTSDAKKLRENSIFKENFNKKYAFDFINKKAKSKFRKKGFVNDFFSRADYIIFGLPINYFEGVLVGREIEKDKEAIINLKKLFPQCYICNLDGKVIA